MPTESDGQTSLCHPSPGALSINKNWVAELVKSFELAGISESFDNFRYEHDPRFNADRAPVAKAIGRVGAELC